MIGSEYNRLRIRISFWCLIVSVVIGTLAIVGWLVDLVFFTRFFLAYIPMAPSTALYFIILGLISFALLNPSKEQKPLKLYTYFLALLAVIDIIIIAEFIDNYQRFDIENFLVQKPGYAGGYLLGRMSPLTGFLFLLEIVALWLYTKENTMNKTIASISTTIGSLITLILILGYMYGTPLLYGRSVIPPALNTSLAFAFSFFAILLGFGGEYWPIKLFAGKSVRAKLMRTLLPTIILVIILSGWITSIVYYSTEDHLLIFSLITILTIFILSYIISKISRSIGGSIDEAFEKINRARASLKESEEKFGSLAEESPNMIFINKGGHIVYANKKCEEVMGYTRHELYDPKFNFLDLIAPEDVERVQQVYSRKLAGKNRLPSDYTIITKDKKRIDVVLAARVIDYEGGKAILGIITDITDRKQFEKELVENELRYRILFENTPVGIVMMDEHENILLINKAFESIFQYSLDEIKGRYIDNVIVPREHYDEAGSLFSSIIDGNVIAKETIRKRKDNSLVHVQIYGFPIVVNRKCIGIYGMYIDMTERNRAEQRIAETLKLNETILQTSPVGIIAYKNNGEAVSANEAAAAIVGTTVEILLKQNFQKLESWKKSGLLETAAEVLKNGVGSSIESHFVTTFGKEVWLSGRLESFNYGDEQHLLLVFEDVRERKLALEKLEKSEKRFKLLFNSINDAVFVHAFENNELPGKFIEINNAASMRYGYTHEEFLNMSPLDIDAPEGLNLVPGMMKKLKKEGYAVWEGMHVAKSGKKIPVEISNFLFELNGRSTILATVRDITERKKAESEIKMLARAVESVSECISITDHNDIILFVNDSFLKTYGYRKEELIGKHIDILRPPNISSSTVRDILPETIKGGWKGEVLNCKKDGTIFPVMISTSVIKDNFGWPIALIGVATDITEIKKAHEELIKAKELAEKSAALKSEFLAQMSHEIRSPLNVTLSFANMLKEEFKDRITPEVNEYFEGIELTGRRLIRTVDLILNASEMQIGTYEPIWTIVDLKDDIFKSVYSEYAGYARKKRLELNIVSKVSDSRVNGDRYSIFQIFANLVDNAIKYTDAGKVEITIERDESNYLKVTVEDTGIGMSEEFMKRIFQPFMQEYRGYSRKYEGNGLGLSLVKKYCDLNEAQIKVESQKEIGSKFIVTFKKGNGNKPVV